MFHTHPNRRPQYGGDTVNRLVDNFLNYLSVEKGLSTNTISAYRNDLNQFVDLAGIQNENGLTEIDRDRILNYIVKLRQRIYSPTTVARKTAAVRSLFHYLVREDIMKEDPTENLAGSKLDKALPNTLSISQIEELLAQPAKHSTPEAKRDKAMLELLYATGVRVSEMVSLDLDDLNLDDGFVRCFGKGSKERMTPLHEQAIRDLIEYINEARPQITSESEKALFVNRRGQRLTRQGFWLILKNYAKAAGMWVCRTVSTLKGFTSSSFSSSNAFEVFFSVCLGKLPSSSWLTTFLR